MTAIVLRGDARQLPLPDGCVDLIVTSPPYFGLRSYTDGGEHYAGQIGGEATPQEWLAALQECTAEWVRVLKPEGSLFVNLGDKYSGSHGNSAGSSWSTAVLQGGGYGRLAKMDEEQAMARRIRPGLPAKSLLGLPWRYAIGCTDRLGLILRAEIVWAKPNGLPESVTDRVRRSHEQVFHFTRQPRYYAAVDEIREPHTGPDVRPGEGHGTGGWPRCLFRRHVPRPSHPPGHLPCRTHKGGTTRNRDQPQWSVGRRASHRRNPPDPPFVHAQGGPVSGKNKNPLLGWHPPAELQAWARAEAGRRGVPLSVILNEALEHYRRACLARVSSRV